MQIKSVHLRRFRGLGRASLQSCAALNVLIGRNNAGKSSILAAIELALDRLQGGRAASIWRTPRPNDEFTGRDVSKPLQIGLTFEAKEAVKGEFQERLLKESPGLDVAVSQLTTADEFSVIFAADVLGDSAVIYLQEVGVGGIDSAGDNLTLSGTRIMSIPQSTAQELGKRENDVRNIESELRSLEEFPSNMIDYAIRQKNEGPSRWRTYGGERITSRRLIKLMDDLFSRSSSKEEVETGRSVIKDDLNREIQDLEEAELSSPITTFAGTSKKIPDYASWLMQNLADGKVVSFKEVRKSVGREEASQLLDLKLRRGGTQSLARIQETVRALLGVEVDAFQGDDTVPMRRGRAPGNAEMDIDDFLVEANGAGIREALRIILDLELGSPVLATVEEPEVHLHPGLERVVHRYLVDKSRDMQLFVATHSANFLDSTTRQNVYLVSRDKGATSKVEKVASENDLLMMSQEIGLRPSTVLMFDRLVFVEGPSDEGIVSELSRALDLDLASENATFVQMAGSTGFSHFAADATLDLLSRRQIRMWFIVDNDERSESDVKKMVDRIGDRAKLVVLKRRELENYLLAPEAVVSLISEKLVTAGDKAQAVDKEQVRKDIAEVSEGLLDRAVQLLVEKKLLTPIYARYGGDTVTEKLEKMADAANERAKDAAKTEEEVRNSLADSWKRDAVNKAPGSEILDGVLKKYGLAYNKTKDGPRLARSLGPALVDHEIASLLGEITQPEGG